MPRAPKERTSQGYRCSILRRVVRYARKGERSRVEALLTSDEFVHALSQMTQYDRRVTMASVGDAQRKLWELAPIPETKPGAVRNTWDDAAIARVRAISARFGVRPGLDRVIAREIGRPLPAVTLARYTYVGRIRAAQPNRKKRRRGLPDVSTAQAGVSAA